MFPFTYIPIPGPPDTSSMALIFPSKFTNIPYAVLSLWSINIPDQPSSKTSLPTLTVE